MLAWEVEFKVQDWKIKTEELRLIEIAGKFSSFVEITRQLLLNRTEPEVKK